MIVIEPFILLDELWFENTKCL